MAETITISSSSVFLGPLVVEQQQQHSQRRHHPSHRKKSASSTTQPKQRRSSSALEPKPVSGDDPPSAANTSSSITKPKRFKSRNGCLTCKAKRLKCDETKPACQQCRRRSVACGGYTKHFKWRPFEETNLTGSSKSGVKQRKASTSTPCRSLPPTVIDTICPGPSSPPLLSLPLCDGASSMVDRVDENYPTVATARMSNDAVSVEMMQPATTTACSLPSQPSPRPVDLLLPRKDMDSSPSPGYCNWLVPYPDLLQHSAPFDLPAAGGVNEDDVEDIFRELIVSPDHGEAWIVPLPSPAPSESRDAPRSAKLPPGPLNLLLYEPSLALDSPELMTWRFDQQTCGILSIKDGPTENPWRTLIWPLAKDSPALYHAIAAMANFHASRHEPQLRVRGIGHMRTSIEALASGMHSMRIDAAIATTLALAFSESWDQHTSTGIDHIKGAKCLVRQALVEHQQTPLQADDLARLRFLCNAWVYMDVIARLTSDENDESTDFDTLASTFAGHCDHEAQLDPLMGCAATLFPIIGHVANLVRRVRRSESNSPAVISQAMELKTQLEDWLPQALFEVPEDPTSHVQHSLQTAEAYRWATLLYLHQAVPEIPSLSSAELAKKVLVYLATVPLASRAVIVHIYPLMAAGSEAATDEDRDWVRQRWEAMARRMLIGIVDRCLDITREVWARRDAYAARTRSRSKVATKSSSSSDSSGSSNSRKRGAAASPDDDEPVRWNENYVGANKRRAAFALFDLSAAHEQTRGLTDFGAVDSDFTVQGRLHWLSVMKDWGWEVLLG